METGNYPISIILKVDLASEDAADAFEQKLHDQIEDGIVDGFYFLTRNGDPVRHTDEHLEPENRLGNAISAIQRDEILYRALSETLSDTDPETGIEYGDLT